MNMRAFVKNKFTEVQSKRGFFKHLTRKKVVIIVGAVLVIAILLTMVSGFGNKKDNTEPNYVEVQAKMGNVLETIEQSGIVEPLERYEITSLVRGEIISSPFEEGDYVNEGDTLYQIDDEDAQLSMEKAQMSLDEANDNVSKLSIYAPASGRLSDFTLEVGSNVGNGLIGNIVDTNTLSVDVPFSLNDFDRISVGDSVTITSALYMTSLPGTVTHKYYANAETGSDSSILRNVEITLENPGALAENTTFAATVHTNSGDVYSSGSGTLDNGSIYEIRAEVSGTVSYVGFKNGDYVTKGQLIAKLTNNSIVNTQKSNKLNVKSNQKTLDNYNITAPISGTVITKNSKAGDNIDSSNSQTVMMVVADMSKMKFTISVDELDISDIHLGQTAIVDADALPDETFEARVTSIASEGVSSGDGVTTYDIELTIDEPGELRSGMNVNANILIYEAYDVLTIPEEALMNMRGTSAAVLVKSDGSVKNNNKNNDKGKNDKPQSPQGGNAGGEEMPERGGMNNIPAGYETRQVEVGVSDGTNVEIVSGLSEGDTIIYIPSTANSQNGFMGMMRMMGRGMPGGGMPAGGGMPGGR